MNAVILIIDRNDAGARSSQRVLKNAGYEVVLCPNDEDARQYMREHHVDVVVVQANVEDTSERKLSEWHEKYVPNAFYHRTSSDAQHLLTEVENAVGDVY